jgi:predicted dehydrogenase
VSRRLVNGSAGNRPVRLAVVGLGYWGPTILRNAFELPDSEVVWACDLKEEARDSIKRRYPTVQTTSHFEDVLEDPSVEAVVVATPISTHHKLAAACLRAGKHVLVEKPLAASSVQAADLINTAAQAGLILMPGHTFLYSPPVNIVRDLIRSGELGEIYFVSMSRVNLGLHQSDVSVLWDLGPHDFSILRYWLNETPVSIDALSRDCIVPGIPDVAFVNLEFASGTVAHVELAWLAPSKLLRTTVVGSEKMAVYDDTSTEPVRIFDSGAVLQDPQSFGQHFLSYRTGDIVSPRVEPSEPLRLELADFCSSIRSGVEPRSNAVLGLDVIRMIETAERSLKPAVERAPRESLTLLSGS